MIARPLQRTQPIPFAAPAYAGFGPRVTASGPAPVHWGDRPGGALVAQAEDPKALYAVTRSWQGQPAREEASPAEARNTSRAHALNHALRGTTPPAELVARYVGQGSLCVRSSVTGRHYRFQKHGDTLRIDKHDMMLMRRIADVELS
ncbi:MAG: hypothetical protein RI907_600 [Pseudomonadota bacterium]|jgi:hypothetical protein